MVLLHDLPIIGGFHVWHVGVVAGFLVSLPREHVECTQSFSVADSSSISPIEFPSSFTMSISDPCRNSPVLSSRRRANCP